MLTRSCYKPKDTYSLIFNALMDSACPTYLHDSEKRDMAHFLAAKIKTQSVGRLARPRKCER